MTTTTVPAVALLTDPITRWAAAQPDAPCVGYQDQNYTWAQWAERVQRVSGALRMLGIPRGERVATIDMNNLATVEVTNGAAAIGAAHVIVNFRLFGDQLAYVLADSAPKVVFVGADVRAAYDAIADRVPSVEKVIVLGGDDDELQDWVAAGEPEPTGSVPHAAADAPKGPGELARDGLRPGLRDDRDGRGDHIAQPARTSRPGTSRAADQRRPGGG